MKKGGIETTKRVQKRGIDERERERKREREREKERERRKGG